MKRLGQMLLIGSTIGMAEKAKKKERPVVKVPLEPTIMSRMGALEGTELPSGEFDPNSDWAHNYRIWTCVGHMEPTQNQGTISISKSADGKQTNLKINQVVHPDPKVHSPKHHIEADILCHGDLFSTPVSWTLASRFTGGPKYEKVPLIDYAEKATVNGENIDLTIGGEISSREVSSKFTADWCLFEAVQRLEFGRKKILEFDFLEGLTVFKAGQKLSYRGQFPVNWNKKPVLLHRFEQFGTGVWPYEYWLDQQHRLVLVVTGPRAYIWDGQGCTE